MTEAQLPPSIELTLTEARDVLFALDRAAEMGQPGSVYHHEIRSAIHTLTRKMWPELGRLLDEDEE